MTRLSDHPTASSPASENHYPASSLWICQFWAHGVLHLSVAKREVSEADRVVAYIGTPVHVTAE